MTKEYVIMYSFIGVRYSEVTANATQLIIRVGMFNRMCII